MNVSRRAPMGARGQLETEGGQTRGGRKGGLAAGEGSGSVAVQSPIFPKTEGNTTSENGIPEKLKHFNAQAAMLPQPSMALSQGSAWCGQQSMSSICSMDTWRMHRPT